MNHSFRKLFLASISGLLLQGCVAIPPLIQVQHKDSNNNDLKQRLDSIDRRLEKLEQSKEPPR